MSALERKYYYKIFNGSAYLGMLPNVISDFSYRQDINTGSAELNIEVELSLDRSSEAPDTITDESGNTLTDETTMALTTETVTNVVGAHGAGTLIATNNNVYVYEISDSNPNGKLVFAGFMSRFDYSLANRESVAITVISFGKDLVDYVFGNNIYTLQTSQTSAPMIVDFFPSTSGPNIAIAQSISGLSYNLAKIRISAAAGNSTGASSSCLLTLKLYSGTDPRTGGSLLATVSVNITNAYPAVANVDFILPSLVALGGTNYYWTVEGSTNWSIQGAFDSSNPYAGGQALYYFDNVTPPTWFQSGTDDMVFYLYSSTAIATTAAFTSYDPAQMIRDALDNYLAQGGLVTYTGASIVNTVLALNYTFITATILEIINKAIDLAPYDWFWYVDPATQVLYFKETATTATHKFILGRHLFSLDLSATIENVTNVVYFTGGPTAGVNLLKLYSNLTSLTAYRRGMKRLNDNRVTDATTASTISNGAMNQNLTEKYLSQIEISAEAYDISSINLGDVVAFEGFGNFIDYILVQITSIRRQADSAILTLGPLQTQDSNYVNQLASDIIDLQTLQNPTTPS